jgi:hypothetical protein
MTAVPVADVIKTVKERVSGGMTDAHADLRTYGVRVFRMRFRLVFHKKARQVAVLQIPDCIAELICWPRP